MRPTSLTAILALFALPLLARADHNPDFADDATPILRMQPHLLRYVQSTFEVKDTGIAQFPGNDDRPPRPPFIFEAKPIGAPGPFTLRLLIEPGPPGHILKVVDMTKVHLHAPNDSAPPEMANQQPPPPVPASQAPASQPMKSAPAQKPAPAPTTTEPTADTPSGPITSSGSVAPSSSTPSSAPQSLEPPPDPAPPAH
jgi:hypothetical protein